MFKKLENGNYEISEELLQEYLLGFFKNEAREIAGVDNWEWDGEAMQEYLNEGYSEEESFDEIEDIVQDYIKHMTEKEYKNSK